MNPKRFAIGSILLLGSAVSGPVHAAERLVFNSVAPCRIINTRLSPAGPLAANETRTFHVVGSTSDFTAQGGHAGGCGLPGFAGPGQPQVQAVLVNFVAVSPAGAGDLRGWASDGIVPTASILNYAKVTDETLPGVPLNIANGIGLPVRQDVEGADISIKADVSGTHVVADVVGYWRTLTLPAGAVGTPQIADGSVTGAKIANGAVVRSLNAQTDTLTLAGTNGLSVSAGGGTVTVTSNATPSNTANRIVSRDSSGNFSAGMVTLSGLLASMNGGGSAVDGFQNGTGNAGSFSINNAGSSASAVFASTDSTSGATAIYAVATGSIGPWAAGVTGEATTQPNGAGVVGKGTQNGVWAQGTGTTGYSAGVSGEAIMSPDGVGVSGRGTQNGLRGQATQTTGYAAGVSGEAIMTPDGVGVSGRGTQNGLSGQAIGTTGYATGVVGRAVDSPDSSGVFAEGIANGVFARGTTSGVSAEAIGTTGFTIALNGWAVTNPYGIGAQGIGAGTGLIGTTQSCNNASIPGGCATPGIAGQFVTGNGGTQTGGADFAESVAVAKSASLLRTGGTCSSSIPWPTGGSLLRPSPIPRWSPASTRRSPASWRRCTRWTRPPRGKKCPSRSSASCPARCRPRTVRSNAATCWSALPCPASR